MEVVKRSGKAELVSFDKITARIQKLCYGLDPEKVQATRVAQKVCAGVYPNVTTVELDDLAAQTAAYMSTDFPDYSLLAARIAVSNLHKMTKTSFMEVMTDLRTYLSPKTKKIAPMISEHCEQPSARARADGLAGGRLARGRAAGGFEGLGVARRGDVSPLGDRHTNTRHELSHTRTRTHTHTHPRAAPRSPELSPGAGYKFMVEHKDVLDAAIVYDRDYSYDFFAYKTLERAYLMKLDGKIVERPQHMIMR